MTTGQKVFIAFVVAWLGLAIVSIAQGPEPGGSSGVGAGTTYTFNSPLSETGGTVTCPTCSVADTNGRVLLATCTASASASCDFTSIITATYDQYEVELGQLTPATNARQLLWRFSTNNGSSYDSGNNYVSVDLRWNASTSAFGGSETGTDAFKIPSAAELSNAATASLTGTFKFWPSSATKHKTFKGEYFFNAGTGGGSGHRGGTIGGAYLSATAVNAFQFLMDSGDIASGVIRVYGIAK